MPDREKVIKGLEKCRRCECDDCTEKCASKAPWDCPAYDNFVDSAIAMLKEHEAKEVKESTNMYTGLPITHCPKCGVSLDRYLYGRQHEGQINYCPICGQAVKWE